MSSPIQDLTVAIREVLINSEQVTAFIDNRIYDRVAENTPYPYVTFGTAMLTSDDYDCFDLNDISLQIDIWSQEAGKNETYQICEAIRKALLNSELQLSDENLFCLLKHQFTQVLNDPDGLTIHGVMHFTASIQSL